MGNKGGKPVLREEDLKALASTSGLRYEDLQQKLSFFIQEHPDGKINRKSFSKMLATALSNTSSSKLLNLKRIETHVFRIYDLDRNGEIDFIEFMVVYHVLSDGTPEQVLDKIFRMFDVNSDGHISRIEMKRIVEDLQGICSTLSDDKSHKNIAETAFDEMDFDKDGRVSREEFIQAVLSKKKISRMLTLNVINIFIDVNT